MSTSCIRPVTRAKQIAFHTASRSLFRRTLCSFSSTFRMFFFWGGEIALSCIESKRRRPCERRQNRTGTTWWNCKRTFQFASAFSCARNLCAHFDAPPPAQPSTEQSLTHSRRTNEILSIYITELTCGTMCSPSCDIWGPSLSEWKSWAGGSGNSRCAGIV